MDNATTMRTTYDLLNAGDIDGFGDLLTEDFVEHEETPGLGAGKEGVLELFRMYLAAFPDLHMEPVDVIEYSLPEEATSMLPSDISLV